MLEQQIILNEVFAAAGFSPDLSEAAAEAWAAAGGSSRTNGRGCLSFKKRKEKGRKGEERQNIKEKGRKEEKKKRRRKTERKRERKKGRKEEERQNVKEKGRKEERKKIKEKGK